MPHRDTPEGWKVWIDDMLEAATRVHKYLDHMTLEEFGASEKTVDAVARNFEILGEAATQVPPGVRNRYPQVPWPKIRGLRNIVAHQYFALNLGIIWQTAKDDLPALTPLLREILEKEL